MLFLGLGTGLGSAMVVAGRVEPLELAHLPYKDKNTYEDVLGLRGLERLGKKKWRRQVNTVIEELSAALQVDYVVVGGGNARLLAELPANTRLGANTNAFKGGFLLWSAAATALQPAPAVPRQVGERLVVDSSAALSQAAASEFFLQAIAAVNATGRFMVALSGGSTPRGLYELLATDPKWRAEVPWDRTHFFWGDERHVPPDHAESNFRLANEALLSLVPVAAANIHRILAEAPSAAEAADKYEGELRSVFQLTDRQFPRFDLILLGLGSEGHTASLFPGTRALAENQRLVVSNWVGKLYADRITLTPPVLNNARCVMFMATGNEKATVLKAILEGPYEPDQLPAQVVNPTDGRLVWLLDRAAASALSGQT
jgi:6-phosphogluconolactonase